MSGYNSGYDSAGWTECRNFINGYQVCGDCTITAKCGAIPDVVASLTVKMVKYRNASR